jgi:hypothetical protein
LPANLTTLESREKLPLHVKKYFDELQTQISVVLTAICRYTLELEGLEIG